MRDREDRASHSTPGCNPAGALKVVLASHGSRLLGGAERNLCELAIALSRDGRVEPVVTVPAEGPLTDALRSVSIRTLVMPTPRWTASTSAMDRADRLGAFSRRIRSTCDAARAALPWFRWLRAEQPDVVLTSTATIPSPAFACAAARIPHVWYLKELVSKDHGLCYALGEPASQRLIGWLSDVVIGNSRAVERHFSPPIRQHKMRMIHSGIASPDVRMSKIVPPPPLRLLLLGNQTPGKGSPVALEALAILRRGTIEAKLRLVGSISSTYRGELVRYADELGVARNVEILDFTTDPGQQLAWANVLLMCSVNEAYGRVTVEGLKSGRPVVGARSGGTTELISEGVNGFLFEPGNAHDLASALRRLADEPNLLMRMSENARNGARDRFTLEGQVDALVAEFNSVVGRM